MAVIHLLLAHQLLKVQLALGLTPSKHMVAAVVAHLPQQEQVLTAVQVEEVLVIMLEGLETHLQQAHLKETHRKEALVEQDFPITPHMELVVAVVEVVPLGEQVPTQQAAEAVTAGLVLPSAHPWVAALILAAAVGQAIQEPEQKPMAVEAQAVVVLVLIQGLRFQERLILVVAVVAVV